MTWDEAFASAGAGADAVTGAVPLVKCGPADDDGACASAAGDEAVGCVFFTDGSGRVVAADLTIGVAAGAGGRTADGTATATGAVELDASGFGFSVGEGTGPDLRGAARTATTSVAMAASAITREYDITPTRPAGADDTGLTRGAESADRGALATADVFKPGFLALARDDADAPCRPSVFDARRFVGDCFDLFVALDVDADFFSSTSAETSNVQRTRRPLVGGGILIARFGTMKFVRG